MNYDLTQPWLTLDDWQKDYIETPPDQDCFLLTGRQVGKTAAMSIKAVEMAVHHFKKEENILICSITEKQAYRMLAKALAYAQVKYPRTLIQKGRDKPTMHKVMFKDKDGMRGIYCYAAGETGEGLRGDTIKKLMIDEGSRMTEEFFIATTPMLSVSKGSMDIASTPFGKKDKEGRELFFYQCSKDDRFRKFYVSAEDCPRHDKAFLEREKERMSRLQYAQEYLAQFLDELQQVFSDEWIKNVCVMKRQVPILQDRRYYLGADIAGLGEDQVAISIFKKRDDGKIEQVESLIRNKKLTTETSREIMELNSKYNEMRKIGIDDGGLGFGVWSELMSNEATRRKTIALNNSSRPVDREGVKSKRILKEEMYYNLIALGEQGKIYLLDDDEVKASLRSIQYEEKKIFGSYSHITEGIIRGVWVASQDKSLNIYVY